MVFIGVFEATINSPSGATDRAARILYANAYLKALQERINRRAAEQQIEFKLLSVESGCIICKVAAFLVVGAAAGATVLNQVDAGRYANYLRGTADTWIECRVQRQEWACKLLKLDISFATRFHKTVKGDTLESVLRTKFNVKQADLAATMALTEAWYPHVLDDRKTKSLKPGLFIAHLTPDMPLPPKAVHDSLQSSPQNFVPSSPPS